MYVIRKLIKFEMAHRLETSYTKACQCPHGHSYTLELFFKSEQLNSDGMVLDFKKVKDKLKKYIVSWDHKYVYKSKKLDNNPPGIKCVTYNPTAENMARDMYDYIKKLFPILWKVRLHETDTGYAEYFEEDTIGAEIPSTLFNRNRK